MVWIKIESSLGSGEYSGVLLPLVPLICYLYLPHLDHQALDYWGNDRDLKSLNFITEHWPGNPRPSPGLIIKMQRQKLQAPRSMDYIYIYMYIYGIL